MRLAEGLHKFEIYSVIKKIILFFSLLVIVLMTNASIISFNLMYPEQPSIYLANQTIHHMSDLINIYLHPKLLNQNIPFFRPSGHFLLYQLLTPFLGWHNTKAFFVVSLILLSLIGFFIIEIYQLLFPRYKIGGYVAFSLYLMHPALSLARVTLMHFEFAYVFFLMFSLYVFIIFCQKNHAAFSQPNKITNKIKFKSISIFIYSLLIYVIAVTFKEPAVMLGPVFMCYFWIYFFEKQSLRLYFSKMMTQGQPLLIMFLMTFVSLLLGLYLIASWPNLKYPISILEFNRSLGAINSFFIDVWGFDHEIFKRGFVVFNDLAWRTIIFPLSARLMIWTFFFLSLISALFLFKSKSTYQFFYKKSFIFLLIAAILFLILPFAWATAGPWHYTLTLIFVNLIMGFSLEYTCHLIQLRKQWIYIVCLIAILLNLFLTLQVNDVNIKKYDHVPNGKIGLAVNRNAIANPPNIKNKLTSQSVIVVEDSRIHNDYLMGNGAYPFILFLGKSDYDLLEKKQERFFLKFQSNYGSNLFRYAYLMPNLKEQLYPFHVEDMSDVPNEILYNWLKHYNDIFCLGYDALGNWHDKTIMFKQQLMKEQAERELKIHSYTHFPVALKNTNTLESENLFYPDAKICQYRCDQNEECVGFIYQHTSLNQHSLMQCIYSNKTYKPSKENCINCVWYSK